MRDADQSTDRPSRFWKVVESLLAVAVMVVAAWYAGQYLFRLAVAGVFGVAVL